MKRNKNKIFIAACLLVGIFFSLAYSVSAETQLSQEEVANLVKPSVVRIAHHITGEITLPVFDLDLQTLSFTLTQGAKPAAQTVDEYVTGSGFVVNSQGYILTNSHVVSTETIKDMYILEAAKGVISKKTEKLSEADLDKLFASQEQALDFAARLISFVNKNGSFKLKSKVTVLSPVSSGESLDELLRSGFPAEIISVNNKFLDDEKDVALIKINQSNTPGLALGTAEGLSTGNGIYVFGFPATAEFNRQNPLESTFTKGLVNAIKFSASKEFRVVQTDAKISQGSSGGPLLNEKGQVIGIITFETGELDRQTGDNFAFAIPIELAKEVLKKHGVTNEVGTFAEHFRAGLVFYNKNYCQQALEEFHLADKTNELFAADKYLKPYRQRCENLIASGQSLDNLPAKLGDWLKTVSGFAWFVVLGRAALAGFGAWVVWLLYKRLRRDEHEMVALSADLETEKDLRYRLLQVLQDKGIHIPVPDEETHASARQELAIPHPHLAEYVEKAKEVGMQEGMIHKELKSAGWGDHEIYSALKNKPA